MIRRTVKKEAHGFLPYDYYVSSELEGQELFDAVRIGDEMYEVGTEKVPSKGLHAYTVIDRTPKRIYIRERDWSGASPITLTPNTVENDLFYYKHFNTKHYLSWQAKGQMLNRPEKPKPQPQELPGNRKALAKNEVPRRTMGGDVEGGYAAISDGLFCYYSTMDSVEELSLHMSKSETPMFSIPSSTPMYRPLGILNASEQICSSLSQFQPIKSSVKNDYLAVDIVDFVEDENTAFGCFTNSTFKMLKKFFRADPSQVSVGVAPLLGSLFFVLSTSDRSEIGVFLMSPERTFESRMHGRSRSRIIHSPKIRGTYGYEQRRLPISVTSRTRRHLYEERNLVKEYDYSEARLYWCLSDGSKRDVRLSDIPRLIRDTYKPMTLPLGDSPVPDYALYAVPSYASVEDVCKAVASETTTDEDTGKPVQLDLNADPSTWIRRIMDAGSSCYDCMLSIVFRLHCSTRNRANTVIDIACETDVF